MMADKNDFMFERLCPLKCFVILNKDENDGRRCWQVELTCMMNDKIFFCTSHGFEFLKFSVASFILIHVVNSLSLKIWYAQTQT